VNPAPRIRKSEVGDDHIRSYRLSRLTSSGMFVPEQEDEERQTYDRRWGKQKRIRMTDHMNHGRKCICEPLMESYAYMYEYVTRQKDKFTLI
jgi:hypothetical protein